MKQDIPIWKKYSLSITEASTYYGIGIKKIYKIVHENPNADFILEVGSNIRIKRIMFEKFLDGASAI